MTKSTRILLVDDEVAILRAMMPLLRSQGYAVAVASTGHEALQALTSEQPDLIILDLGLPDIEGGEVGRQIRQSSNVPVVVLSVRNTEQEKVTALDWGADDYVTKPFGPDELLARIRAALRRVSARDAAHGAVRAGDLVIDIDRRRVFRGEDEIRLTPKEFELLQLLATNTGRVMTHRAIMTTIWGARAADQPERLRVLVGQLRKKIEVDATHPRFLLTEPWVGYRFDDAPIGS